MTKLLLLLFILTSCHVPVEKPLDKESVAYKNRHRNRKDLGRFYYSDGSCINYIGHRMGGDYRDIKDNTIKGGLLVKPYERHPCFRAWEFDLNSAKDCVLVRHDYYYFNSEGDKKLVKNRKCNHFASMEMVEFIDRLILEINPQVLVKIDLKDISKKHWSDVIVEAEKLRDAGIKIKFQSRERYKGRYSEFEKKIIEAGFKGIRWNY